MQHFKNRYCLIALIVGLVIGFLVGMEYKAYQIRSAFNDVTEGFNELFGNDEASDTDEPARGADNTEDIREATDNEKEDTARRLRELVDLEVVGKDFIEEDWVRGIYESKINFDFKFVNKTDKDVRGVQGEIIFYDIFDNEIYDSSISYDEGVPANDSYTWKAGVNYNEFIDEHQKLMKTELRNLQFKWVPNTIIFADGTKEE